MTIDSLIYPSPPGYEIMIARPGDEAGMTEVHAQAFVAGYQSDANPEHGRSAEKLHAFAYDKEPGVGFYDRNWKIWEGLTNGNQPDDNLDQLVLVAHERATGTIVGLGAGIKRLVCQPEPADPLEQAQHIISALYVHPDHQGQGLGSALLNPLAAHLGGRDIALRVTRRAPAIGFYKRHGFIIMPWRLKTPELPWQRNGILLEQVGMFCIQYTGIEANV